MGWVERRGKKFRLSFRYGGEVHRHSLKTEDQREADECLALVERNLRLLDQGVLELPPGADLALFLPSNGRRTKRAISPAPLSIAEVFRRYCETHTGSQEDSTLRTAKIHEGHLVRLLGASLHFQAITLEKLQGYVAGRAKEKGLRGRTLSPATIRKEVTTLSSVWNWAARMGLAKGDFPGAGIVYAKAAEKPPFQTRAEIERQVARGGMTEAEKAELWDCLFLTLPEVAELLEYVERNARHRWIYPMFLLAAHTGARRSEILRAKIGDFDFEAGHVTLSERKKDRTKRTLRRVPLSPKLSEVMQAWFAVHPGGRYAICQELNIPGNRKHRADYGPVTVPESNHHFQQMVSDSKWSVLRGWHLLRHSFASNCAAQGVDQRLIDAWMEHQTEEMRRRYQHLVPDQQGKAIRSVFG